MHPEDTDYNRRQLILSMAGLTTLAAIPSTVAAPPPQAPAECDDELLCPYLRESVLRTPANVDALLLGEAAGYILRRYHPELGYMFTDGRWRHGVDGSVCTYTYGPDGARRMIAIGA